MKCINHFITFLKCTIKFIVPIFLFLAIFIIFLIIFSYLPSPKENSLISKLFEITKLQQSNPPVDIYQGQEVTGLLQYVQNLLVYFSILVIIITLIVTFLAFKGFSAYHEIRQQLEKTKTLILDSSLTTVSSVPLLHTTQITSSEYSEAIQIIADTVHENKDITQKQNKYAPLIVIDALNDWMNADFEIAKRKLESIYFHANTNVLRDKIAFYTARAYKQLGSQQKEMNEVEYFRKSEEWTNKIKDKILKNIIKLSICASKINLSYGFIEHQKDIHNILLLCFDDNFENIESFMDAIKNKDIKILPNDLSKLTALTITALDEENKIYHNTKKINYLDIRKKCAIHSLEWGFEPLIHIVKGLNIKASWYLTMAHLAKIIGDPNLLTKYTYLARSYFNHVVEKDIQFYTLFYFKTLAEIELNEFDKKLKEFENLLIS